jgi:hypothetical protein
MIPVMILIPVVIINDIKNEFLGLNLINSLL